MGVTAWPCLEVRAYPPTSTLPAGSCWSSEPLDEHTKSRILVLAATHRLPIDPQREYRVRVTHLVHDDSRVLSEHVERTGEGPHRECHSIGRRTRVRRPWKYRSPLAANLRNLLNADRIRRRDSARFEDELHRPSRDNSTAATQFGAGDLTYPVPTVPGRLPTLCAASTTVSMHRSYAATDATARATRRTTARGRRTRAGPTRAAARRATSARSSWSA